MHEFGDIGFIDDFNGDRLPLFHAKHRTRRRSVVTDGANDAGWCEFHCNGRNPQSEIRFGSFLRSSGRLHASHTGLRLRHQQPRRAQFNRGDSTEFHKFPSVHTILRPSSCGRSELFRVAAPKEKSSHGGMAGSRSYLTNRFWQALPLENPATLSHERRGVIRNLERCPGPESGGGYSARRFRRVPVPEYQTRLELCTYWRG